MTYGLLIRTAQLQSSESTTYEPITITDELPPTQSTTDGLLSLTEHLQSSEATTYIPATNTEQLMPSNSTNDGPLTVLFSYSLFIL